MGERRGAYRIWGGRPEGRRPPGRPRLRWEDYIKVDLEELGFVHGLLTITDRCRAIANAMMNLQVP
jgi:hypothetical protein